MTYVSFAGKTDISLLRHPKKFFVVVFSLAPAKIVVKGTLMQILKSPYMFVLI